MAKLSYAEFSANGVDQISPLRVSVIDADSRRRTIISHFLTALGFEVEAFNSPSELEAYAPACDWVLVADEDNHIRLIAIMLLQARSKPRLLAYAEEIAASNIVEAMREGVLDYLEWPACLPDICGILMRVGNSGAPMEGGGNSNVGMPPRAIEFTPREMDVLKCHAAGQSTKEAANALEISPSTLAVYRTNILRKLGVPKLSDAVRVVLGDTGLSPAASDEGPDLLAIRSVPFISRDCNQVKIDQDVSNKVRAQWSSPLRPSAPHVGQRKMLADREKEVMIRVAMGMSSKSIANELSISQRTVEVHRKSAKDKLGARNTSEAVMAAIKFSIINPV